MPEKTRRLIYCAVFIAIGTSLSLLSGYFTIFKVTLAPAIVIFAGAALGPFLGGIAGALTDIIKFAIIPTGPYFPGFMLTMALYGVLGGLLFYGKEEQQGYAKIAVGTTAIQTVCSMLINTFWLHILTGNTFSATLLTRIPSTYISCAVYVVILAVLIRNKERIVRIPMTAK